MKLFCTTLRHALTLAIALLPAWAMAADTATAGEGAPIAMTRAQATAIIAANQKIVAPNGIEEQRRLRIGGIEQWISIRGRDLRNPVLLVLHGGPASPDMPLEWTFQPPWEDYFTVVQWDQRGAGKTYASNTEEAMAPGMSVEGMTQDAASLVAYLRKRFGKERIFVMGHSWGSVLGVELARRYPEWLHAYVGVGQIVNMRTNEEAGHAFALREARRDDNAEAIRELESIAPYPGSEGLTLDRIGIRSKWEMHYGGLAWGRRDFQWAADAWRLSPAYSDAEIRAIDKGSLFSLRHLLEPLLAVDFDEATRFRCPVVMFVGAHDYTTSHELTVEWYGKLDAPSKRLVVFADSAHMIMLEQPGRFLAHLLSDVLPYAQQAGDAAPQEETRSTGGFGR
ncbi:MAG: alpha/beta hydrolase [Xanthomonadales bacterium]|nr:alpha/beta hydrolase [Xanthomonadales bacterium]